MRVVVVAETPVVVLVGAASAVAAKAATVARDRMDMIEVGRRKAGKGVTGRFAGRMCLGDMYILTTRSISLEHQPFSRPTFGTATAHIVTCASTSSAG